MTTSTNWWQNFKTKLGYAAALFRAPASKLPNVDLGNGVVLDVRNYSIRIPGKLVLHADSEIRISTKGDIILLSGKQMGEDTGDIHLNPDLNEHGVPLIHHYNAPAEEYGEDDHDHTHTDECKEDNNGNH